MSRTPYFIVAGLAVLLFAWVVNRGPGTADAPSSVAGPDAPTGVDGTPSSASGGSPQAKMAREAWRRAKGSFAVAGAEPEPPPALLDWVDRMLNNQASSPVTQEDVDRWFESGHTNAGDLLAARQVGEDARYLTNALERFPNDPRVLIATTVWKDGPDAHRERLARFKAAAPDNALADYLSAWNEFQAGNPEKALADLAAATQKKGFDDYTKDAMQTAEDLLLSAGRSPAEAKAVGATTTHLPHLSHLRKLSQNIAELQGQYIAAGDQESAVRLARMGIHLGNQLTEGGGSQTMIGELVGIAVQKAVVTSLPGDATYDFLQGEPATYQSRLMERRAALREGTPNLATWIRTANEADILQYFDRYRAEGESAAMKWLREQAKAP
jgi:hypothetical protein